MSNACAPVNKNKPNPSIWILIRKKRLLINENLKIAIPLTKTEYEILELFSKEKNIPISNEQTTSHLGKKPEEYKGMCMCFCRLQKKFKSFTSGDKLFRAARNRGYCLVQKVKLEQASTAPNY